jgi:predicted DCC family thiol-disulfide oxidoreductase YuxK
VDRSSGARPSRGLRSRSYHGGVSAAQLEPTLVFDGDCGFCTKSAHWISRRWTRPARAEPWQRLGVDGLARIGLTQDEVTSAAYWVDEQGRIFRGHAAVGKALRAGRAGDRILGALLLTPPMSWLARPGYRVVARYRYRLPGATDSCRV